MKKEKNIEEAWEALSNLEDKVVLLTDVIERELINESKAVQRAPNSKIKPVEMPGNIEVDVKDKYNTQPKNSMTHNYWKNHRMFRKDAIHNVFHSKLFWIMLVLLPIIFTFIEYILIGWGMNNNLVIQGGIRRTMASLIHWFMLMPILLLSLIIFPAFILMSRESNQFKRYSMNGMSRKQIYWSYIRFSIGFLFVFMFLWMGPWMYFINIATDSIWLDEDQIIAGEHIFKNPWSIFFGTEYYEIDGKNGISIYEFNWYYNMLVTWEMDDGRFTTFKEGFDSGQIILSEWNAVLNKGNIHNLTYDQLQIYLSDMGIQIEYIGIADTTQVIPGTGLEYLRFDERLRFSVLKYHEGVNAIPFLVLFTLVMFGINSVGFSKAMKATSAKTLMGWGIGMWLFAHAAQATTGLLYKDIYKFNAIDNITWNYFVMILLFILKWMFLFSPITIMMVGVYFTMGIINQPEVYELSNFAVAYIQAYENHPSWTETFILRDLYNIIQKWNERVYTPLIQPQTINNLFIGISGYWAIMWTTKTWMFKSRIISYEISR